MARQFSTIQKTGDMSYPPFKLRGVHTFDGNTETIADLNFPAKYIFLESYSEEYKAQWTFVEVPTEENKLPTYARTDRHINMSFKLAARNVNEAQENLDFCTKLARTTLPRVQTRGTVADPVRTFTDGDYYIVNFGTLLREQKVLILHFDMTMDFDAGVFDYGSTPVGVTSPEGGPPPTVGQRSDAHWAGMDGPSSIMEETSYVYHGEHGKVLPKSINVTLNMEAFRDEGGGEPGQLGFGGVYRQENLLGWGLRPSRSLDWPHGTGPIPAAAYCQRDGASAAAPRSSAPNNGTIIEFVDDEEEALEAVRRIYGSHPIDLD